MRKYLPKFAVDRPGKVGLTFSYALTAIFCLAAFFSISGVSCASTTAPRPVVHHAPRVHPAGKKYVAQHSARKRSGHPALRTASAATHRSARHRRRSRRMTRAQKYRLDAALDNVRTHAIPAATEPNSSEDGPAPVGSHPEVPKPLALVIAGTDPATPAGQSIGQPASGVQDAAARAVPAFNLSVPAFMPVALRGSHEVLVHQNIIADVEGLSRIQNDAQLSEMVRSGDLVALPASSALFVDSRLPLNRRYCRPWTAKFLSDLSRAHQTVFGRPLQLTSAVRTVQFQRHLARYNGNAAPAYGDTASPHLTGQAIDLGKKGMSQHEIAWMRTILGQLQSGGKLDVEEEFEQACFHISVYKTYTPRGSGPAHLIAQNDVPLNDGPATKPTIGAVVPAAPVHATLTQAALHRPSGHTRSYYAHNSHRVAAHRRHRHHSSMSLLAVRMR